MKAQKISQPVPSSEPPVPAAPEPTREQVQALAHAIWLDRGCPHGCDVEIWIEAERQLNARPRTLSPGDTLAESGESVDPDRSDAARVDRELDRIVAPPQQRSPTSL